MLAKRRMLVLTGAVAILLPCWLESQALWADSSEELDRLTGQLDRQLAAGNYRDAEQTALEMRRLAEGPLRSSPWLLPPVLDAQADVYHRQGRYAEAEPLYERALRIVEKSLGPNHRNVASYLSSLGCFYRDLGRYAEAEPLLKRALAIREEAVGLDAPEYAYSVGNLAALYDETGRAAEALALNRRVLAILKNVNGSHHPNVGRFMHNLARCYELFGHYAEAEQLYRRALTILENALGPDHPDVALIANNLGCLCAVQGRHAEAKSLHNRALEIREKALGPKHPDVAQSLNNLAMVTQDAVEQERLCRAALAINREALGQDHPETARNLAALASVYRNEGRYADAAPLAREAMAITERVLGPDHPDTGWRMLGLALLDYEQGRYAEAGSLAQRAGNIVERTGLEPRLYLECRHLRALCAWESKRHDEALTELRRAMELAEQERVQAFGAEREHSIIFGQRRTIFERMVAWQTELGDVSESLAAIERSRARSLLDQMELGHADLLAGVPEAEAQRLRERESDAQARIASLEKQLSLVDQRGDLSVTQRQAAREKLEPQLRQARDDYARAYGDIRNASPVYRLAVGQDQKPVSLDALQQWMAQQSGVLLEYLVGTEGGYLLVIPAGESPRLEKLAVSEAQARVLDIQAGPLTADLLRSAVSNEQETGVLQLSREPGRVSRAAPKLATLWEILIPETEREALAAGKFERLIVIPDGQLAVLPFETLVVEPGEDPKYLLDVGPPIQYAPSATILLTLAERSAASQSGNRAPVLTVGDPAYPQAVQVASSSTSVLDELTPRSRYGSLGGPLKRLPYSAWECSWVADVFKKEGIKVGRLDKALATEANVRFNASDRRFLHLACHGLVDQSYGNLFGSLALAPGPKGDSPADDGFLTLAEIYALKLGGTELTILSACDTNFGPQQRGEGVWALSRGFLVAGSRRVVASNWLVDDEAAASLVSYFCSGIAKAEKQGEPIDYATALHKAKRWVRRQEKWQSPYYWGTFVLVGPN